MEIFGITLTNIQAFFVCAAAALVLGAPIAYTYTVKNPRYSKGFIFALYALPFAVMTVLMSVGNQVGVAVTVAGAFALVRFRSYPGTAKEIVNIFFTMTIGVALAGKNPESLIIAVTFTAIACAINLVFGLTALGEKNGTGKTLRITIPESLDYTGVFDDLFEKYTSQRELVSVKTTNMGSMFQLTYEIVLKSEKDERALINDLRCRNGNLDIICAKTVQREDTL